MIWYCTREQVKAALDVAETARSDAQIDRLIAASSDRIESLTNRRFYPERATRYVDWPDDQFGRSWRIWLDRNELLAATAVVAGGVALTPDTDYLLRPDDRRPYNRIEINLSGNGAFSAGNTFQRAIAITGTFGFCDEAEPAATLDGDVDADDTTIAVTASPTIGVGSLLKLADEYLRVVDRTMRTTGQTLQTPLTASMNAAAVAVSNGALFAKGDVLLLDAERMLVVDVAGNTLIVKRTWDGTALATHTGSTIYALRSLQVRRGALGTIAASHLSGAVVRRHIVPELVEELAVAETIVALRREQSGYARTVGSGESVRAAPAGDIRDLRAAVRGRYRRIKVGAA